MDALMWLLLPLLAGIGSSVWAWFAGQRDPRPPHLDGTRGNNRYGPPGAHRGWNMPSEAGRPALAQTRSG